MRTNLIRVTGDMQQGPSQRVVGLQYEGFQHDFQQYGKVTRKGNGRDEFFDRKLA